jgi:3-oxoacyl-[acyl-carrier-protein] synthase II
VTRVVITGLGPVSSIGIGIDAFCEAVRSGRSGISPIRSFDAAGFPHVNAGEVHAFRAEEIVHRIDPAAWGRSSQFAAASARLAVADAGLDLARMAPERVGAVVGTTSGESQVIEKLTATAVSEGLGAMSPALLRQAPAGSLGNAVCEELGVCGESMTLSTACSASNYAIGYAYDVLVAGEADMMIAGGADSVCRWAHAGFFRLGALAKDRCAPFDRDRAGIITGEGGAALVMETLDHARARGARTYAEVLGYALNCDAHHMVSPEVESIAECMRLAHQHAGVLPSDIDYISAHGTGTPANDSVEAQALWKVFGGNVPPVSSIKSMMGHTMGAASGFGATASALAIAHGFLPPTANWCNPDPDMPWLDPVPNEARSARVEVVQNDGFAFGGNNAIVILGAVR